MNARPLFRDELAHLVRGYAIQHSAYTGCSDPDDAFDCLPTARAYMAAKLRRARRLGMSVSVLAPGSEYEITEADDACMVPDDAGIYRIVATSAKHAECWYCGYPVEIGEACDCQNDLESETE